MALAVVWSGGEPTVSAVNLVECMLCPIGVASSSHPTGTLGFGVSSLQHQNQSARTAHKRLPRGDEYNLYEKGMSFRR